MKTFADRERAEEAHYAHQLETLFRHRMASIRYLADWSAGVLGLEDAARAEHVDKLVTFALSQADDLDVCAKLVADLAGAGHSKALKEAEDVLAEGRARAMAA